MDTLERRQKEEAGGMEMALRWLLMLMLAGVFVIHFMPELLLQLYALPDIPDSSVLMHLGFAALLIATIVALLAERSWAFLLLYITVVLAILVMGISLVPWVENVVRPDLATEGEVAANVVVLILGAFCHWLHKNRTSTDLS